MGLSMSVALLNYERKCITFRIYNSLYLTKLSLTVFIKVFTSLGFIVAMKRSNNLDSWELFR